MRQEIRDVPSRLNLYPTLSFLRPHRSPAMAALCILKQQFTDNKSDTQMTLSARILISQLKRSPILCFGAQSSFTCSSTTSALEAATSQKPGVHIDPCPQNHSPPLKIRDFTSCEISRLLINARQADMFINQQRSQYLGNVPRRQQRFMPPCWALSQLANSFVPGP